MRNTHEHVHKFNEHVEKDERVEKVMLTLRDGLLVVRLRTPEELEALKAKQQTKQ